MTNRKLITLGTLLVIPTVCSVAFAQGEGDKHVLDALNALLAANTIECEIRIETFVDGKRHAATGRYEEQALPQTASSQPAPFLRSMYRLEVSLMNATTASSVERNRMILVCHPRTNDINGQIERYVHVEGVKVFSTIDLTRLEQRLRRASNMEAIFAQVSEVRNLGGLAGMMRQIRRFYEFSAPTFENLPDDETIPALKLTGQLRDDLHTDLLERFGGLDKRGRYPANFPSNVEIWIARHNDFPYEIRYLRRVSPTSERKEPLFQESFFNVQLNGAPIPASRFAPLTPPEGVFSVQDDTNRVIRDLGL